jgi:hypothetical protein
MVTLYRVTMKPFGAHGHAAAKRDHATRPLPEGEVVKNAPTKVGG